MTMLNTSSQLYIPYVYLKPKKDSHWLSEVATNECYVLNVT